MQKRLAKYRQSEYHYRIFMTDPDQEAGSQHEVTSWCCTALSECKVVHVPPRQTQNSRCEGEDTAVRGFWLPSHCGSSHCSPWSDEQNVWQHIGGHPCCFAPKKQTNKKAATLYILLLLYIKQTVYFTISNQLWMVPQSGINCDSKHAIKRTTQRNNLLFRFMVKLFLWWKSNWQIIN